MKYRIVATIAAISLIASGLAMADVLPKPVPENQVFTTNSIIDAVGVTQESISLVWEVGDAGLTQLANPRWHPDDLTLPIDQRRVQSGSIAYVTYSDAIATNGGQISLVNSFSLDTHSKTSGLYNIETSKVLTYTSQNGSHLMGAESYVLDIAGNWRKGLDSVVCVFAQAKNEILPAFCNKVTASSKLSSVTTAQVETVGGVTVVSDKADTPAALNYEISVSPDANSASGYADGIISTTFTVSVMEGRNDGKVTEGVIVEDYWTRGGIAWQWLHPPPPPGKLSEATFAFQDGSLLLARVAWSGSTYLYWQTDTPFPAPGTPLTLLSGGVPLPPEAGITITYAGDGTFTMDVTTPYEGMPVGKYIIDTKKDIGGVTFFVSDGPYLEHFDELAAQVIAIDTATVAGGISSFNKAFTYQSGYKCENC
jgi:hypothetical protein